MTGSWNTPGAVATMVPRWSRPCLTTLPRTSFRRAHVSFRKCKVCALSWGYQFNMVFPNCAKSLSKAGTRIELIAYDPAIPADERQQAICQLMRQCRQWLAVNTEANHTDRLIDLLIDCGEFYRPEGTTIEHVIDYYTSHPADWIMDDTMDLVEALGIDLDQVDFRRVAEFAFANRSDEWLGNLAVA
jgi:hypothetical protein